MRFSAVGIAIGITGAFAAGALAAPKPEPGANHTPAVWLNPQNNWVNVHDENGSTYSITSQVLVVGSTSPSDRVRMELRKKAKVVATLDCGWASDEQTDGGDHVRFAKCTKGNLKETGALELDVVYSDDQTDKEYVAGTFQVGVKALKVGEHKGWAFTPDDLLGVTWMSPTYDGGLQFLYWSTTQYAEGTVVSRCTVDGKKLPDFESRFSGDSNLGDIETGVIGTNDATTKKFYYSARSVAPKINVGKRPTNIGQDVKYLADFPGRWQCALRNNGKEFRSVAFTVTQDGKLEQSSAIANSKTTKALGQTIMLDTKFPKEIPGELRVRPDAMKKSIGFGVPWPEGPAAKDAQAALPTTSVGKD